MKTFRFPIIAFTAFSLIFVLVLGGTWGEEPKYDYYASQIIEKGNGTTINVVYESDRIMKVWVDSTALDDYMDEQGINQVNLTVGVNENFVQLDDDDDGTGYYELDITFGPSGAFFTSELEVRLEKDYVSSNVWMYAEDGEALETYEHGSTSKLYFLVPHFSEYYYDDYDY